MERKSFIQMISMAIVATSAIFLIVEEPTFDFSHHPTPVPLITNAYDEIWYPKADPFKNIREKLKQDSIERVRKEIFFSLLAQKHLPKEVWYKKSHKRYRSEYQGGSGDYRPENPLHDDGNGTATNRRTKKKYSYNPRYIW